MVMPRSRSMSMESRIWSLASRAETALVAWRRRSARVDLPWSTWATMEKLRMLERSKGMGRDGRGGVGGRERGGEARVGWAAAAEGGNQPPGLVVAAEVPGVGGVHRAARVGVVVPADPRAEAVVA